MKLVPVENEKNLARDPNTNAIINVSEHEYNSYIARKKVTENEKNKVKDLEEEISSIKDDLDEIKNLLRKFVSE
jgi:hypothetical protein